MTFADKIRIARRAREDELRSRARRRMAQLPTPDVLNWADQAGSGVARALGDYRRDGNPDSLEEARTGIEALLGVVEVLQSRS